MYPKEYICTINATKVTKPSIATVNGSTMMPQVSCTLSAAPARPALNQVRS